MLKIVSVVGLAMMIAALVGLYEIGALLSTQPIAVVSQTLAVALMIWAYYSAQIFLFGAEITRVYANRFGRRIVSKVASASAHVRSGKGGEQRCDKASER